MDISLDKKPLKSGALCLNTDEDIDNFLDELIGIAKTVSIKTEPKNWYYTPIHNKKQLFAIPGFNPYLALAKYDSVSLLVCADARKEAELELWTQDCISVASTLIESSRQKRLGAMWTAVYPDLQRCKEYMTVFSLPAHLLPLALFTFANTEDRASKALKVPFSRTVKKKKFIFF